MATQAFLDTYRRGGFKLNHLVMLTALRDDDSQSDILRMGEFDVGIAAGVVEGQAANLWASAIINVSPIHSPGAFCQTGMSQVSASVVLNAEREFTLPGAVTFVTNLKRMLATHVMVGATVNLYRLIPELAGAGDAQSMGVYAVIGYEMSGSELLLALRQRALWNKPVVPRHISRQEYSRAPDSAIGLGLPIVYGNLSGRGLRRPFTSPLALPYHALEHVRSTHRVSPAILVDTGRGSAAAVSPAAKVLVAGHKCHSIISQTLGTVVFLEQEGRLMMLEPAAGNILNTLAEAGVTLPDNYDFAWFGMAPSEIRTPNTTAFNPRHVLDPSDATYAELDYTLVRRDLQVRLSATPTIGDPVAMELFIGYRSSSNLANCEAGLFNDALSLSSLPLSLPPKTTPGALGTGASSAFGGWGVFPWPDQAWDWTTDRVLRVWFNPAGSPAGWIHVYYVGLVIQYRPREEVVTAERHTGEFKIRRRATGGFGLLGWLSRGTPELATDRIPILEPAVTEMRGRFWCNTIGLEDDALGTYTAIPNAVIERAPDIAKHVLVFYGGEGAAKIDTASMVAARAALVDSDGAGLKYAMSITESADVSSTLATLCLSALMMPVLSIHDDTWKFVVWGADPPVTYPWAFSRWDVVDPMGPSVSPTPLAELLTAVRVAYGYDGFSRSYDSEVAISGKRSVAGHEYFGLRDQLGTITDGKNDRLNFKQAHTGATVFTALLTAGDYATAMDIAKHVGAQMRGAAGDHHMVSMCNVIEVGVNDRLAYTDVSTLRRVGLVPGTYATMELLRREALRALNQSSTIAGASYPSGRVVTMVTDAAQLDWLAVGQVVTGLGMPPGATIVSIGAITFTISADVTAPGSNETLTARFQATWASPAFAITLANPLWAAKFTRGMRLVATGIPATAVITDVNYSTGVLIISASTTAPGTAASISLISSTGSGWLLRYQNGRFGVSKLAGTYTIQSYAAPGTPERLDSAWAVLGFSRFAADVPVPASPTWADAESVRFPDHIFHAGLESTTDLLFQTGADGQDSAVSSRHCGELLGASGSADILQSLESPTGGSTCFYTPRGVQETVVRKSTERYGNRRELEVEGRAIADTRAARSLRGRLMTLLGKVRSVIEFRTTMAPDIERGQVFQFLADMDDFVPYTGPGSDGKWLGKKFVVVEVAHSAGPTSRDTTIVAVDVTS